LRGRDKIRKRYLMHAVAHNLGRVMRKLFKIGTPRSLQAGAEDVAALCVFVISLAFIAAAWLQRRLIGPTPASSPAWQNHAA
jgi:hypothetical protein